MEDLTAGDHDRHPINIEEIFEQFPAAVVVTDEAGKPIRYNQMAVDILGNIPTNIYPEDWPERFGLYLDDGKTYYPGKSFPLLRALRGENTSANEMLFTDHNHHGRKWISISAKPLTSEQGKIFGALMFFSDITPRKQAEISLEQQAERAAASFDLSQQIAQISNDPAQILNTVVVFAADTVGDGCVASLLNLPGNRLRVITFHHVKPTARALLRKSIHSHEYGLTGTIEAVINSGKPLLLPTIDQARLLEVAKPEQIPYINQIGVDSVLVVPIKGRNEVLGTLSLFRDRGCSSYTIEDQSFLQDVGYRIGLAIDNNDLLRSLRMESSGRRIAEKALEQSEVRFRSVFTSTSLGIKILDLEGNLLETNPAFRDMLGYPEDELLGNSMFTYVHPADIIRLQQLLDNLKSGQVQSFQLEHRLRSKSGSNIWVNATFTGVKKNEQEESLAFIVAIAENITEHKRMEAEMAEMKNRLHSHVEMERLQLAQELHDGPLQDLYSAIYKIENWSNQADQGSQARIENLKLELLNVVQGLRNTAKDLRPPALAKFGLEKAIRSHAKEFSESHPELNIHLSLAQDRQTLPEDVRLILFRIYQHSLTNILRHAQASQVYVRFAFDVEEARLEIMDNGIGFVVPGNWVELVRQGHFGLAGAVERVSLLEGTFLVKSTPGVGTTILVVIPIKDDNDSKEGYRKD